MVPVQNQVGLMGPATPLGYNASVMPNNGIQLMPQGVAAAPITANTTVAPVGGGLPVQPNQVVPQTGLIGSEAALTGGLMGSEAALMSGYNDATGMIGQGYSDASDRLTEYRKAMNNRTLNLDTSLGADSVNAINQGVAGFDPYMQGGSNAQKLYDDLTGVNGPEAAAAAKTTYQNSPALQYQMEQMQKATERSSAARGGLLSGRAGLELNRNAQGLASQDWFKNLDAVGASAGRGLEAAAQVGNLRSNQAGMSADLQGMGIQAQAQYEMQKEQTRSDIASKLSGLAESRGINLGGLRVGLSQEQAAGRTNYGQNVATGRTQAGQAIAQNATQASTNIANMLNQQGIGVSDMMSKDISSITDLMYQSGMQDKVDMQNLAALIANINGGQATNVMQGNTAIGAAQAAGQLGVGNAANNAITQGIATGLIGGK